MGSHTPFLAQFLSFVKSPIDIRNRVMHHRSIKQHELDKLRDIGRKVDDLLTSARDRLTEDELIEITSIALPLFAEAVRRQREQIGEYIKEITSRQISSSFSSLFIDAFKPVADEIGQPFKKLIDPNTDETE